MIRLMIVDDHEMLREGLKSKFSDHSDMEVVGETACARDVVPLLLRVKPDVVILDINLPDSSGWELLKDVKKHYDKCKVVVLTMYDHLQCAQYSFENGASGFVAKGSPFTELLNAVRTVHAGKTYLQSGLSAQMKLKKTGSTMDLKSLSAREFEVLLQLSRGFSNKEIASHLRVSTKSVSTYQTRLMEKLGVKNRAEIVRIAIDHGILN